MDEFFLDFCRLVHSRLASSTNITSLVSDIFGGRQQRKFGTFVVDINSNLYLDLSVRDENVRGLAIRSEDRDWDISESSPTDSPSDLTEGSLKLLIGSTDKLIHDEKDPRISETFRPIVASPPWADGTKPRFGYVKASAAVSILRKCIVIGGPGSGKTTLARLVASVNMGALARVPNLDLASYGWWVEPKTAIYFEWRELLDGGHWPKSDTALLLKGVLSAVYDKFIGDDSEKKASFVSYLYSQAKKGQLISISRV